MTSIKDVHEKEVHFPALTFPFAEARAVALRNLEEPSGALPQKIDVPALPFDAEVTDPVETTHIAVGQLRAPPKVRMTTKRIF